MHNEAISAGARTAWLFAALSVLSVLKLAGLGWLYVLLGAAGAAAFFCLLGLLEQKAPEPLGVLAEQAFGARAGGALLLLAGIWTVLVLSSTLRSAATAFPDDAVGPLPVIVAAALTAIACGRGLRACSAAAGVLALILALLYGTIALACLDELEPAWCAVWGGWRQAGRAFSYLLLPSCMLFLPRRQDACRVRPALALLASLPAAPAFLCAACLSRGLSSMLAFPFYTLTKSLSLLSVMERFEPLLSGALLMGFVSLSMLLAQTAGAIFAGLLRKAQSRSASLGACAAGFALSWCIGRLPQQFWIWGATIFWGVFPVVTLLIVALKKAAKKP